MSRPNSTPKLSRLIPCLFSAMHMYLCNVSYSYVEIMSDSWSMTHSAWFEEGSEKMKLNELERQKLEWQIFWQ